MKHFTMDDFNFDVESQPVFDAAGIESAMKTKQWEEMA